MVALIVCQSGVCNTVFAEEETVDTAKAAAEENITLTDSQNKYSSYSSGFEIEDDAAFSDIVLLDEITEFNEGKTLEFKAQTDKLALYYLFFDYVNKEKRSSVISLKLNGTIPFFEAQSIIFPTYWENDGKPKKDKSGNEFSPEQIITDKYNYVPAQDYSGENEHPYIFKLNSGENSISIKLTEGSLKIKRIVLAAVKSTPKYSYKSSNEEKSGDYYEVIEGEEAALKSSSSLIPLSDDSSSDVSPSSPFVGMTNYIGGSNWSNPNDTLIWNFEVKQSGYYSLGFIFRQNINLGGISYRTIKIDGETPFSEARKVKFQYGTSWQYMNFGKDEPYYFYLEKGKHTIAMSVTVGELADVYRRLKEVASRMGNIYIDITMVVGETVDVSRSYELFNQIPDFNERLKSCSDELTDIVKTLEKMQGKKGGSNVATINNAVETIKKMYKNPYSAHKQKSAFYSGYTNISSLLGTLSDMPLDIDRIFVVKKGTRIDDPTSSFARKVIFSVKRFFASFSDDYRSSMNSTSKGLTIWVNWGRDQTQVLDSMVQSDFTENSGIDVDIKLVNATLIQGILAGNGPDVVLHMARTAPVNMAMRGAIIDLSQFSDFQAVMQRFTEDSSVPFTYREGIYALPDTMSFYMMFARTDILESLGLKVPKTWQEFIHATTILQHNNLQSCLPYTAIADSTTVDIGVGGLTLYPTFLLQSGLSLYNKELNKSTLTNEKQISVFNTWTDLYTKYKVPVTTSFYNRFRIGSSPLGIAPYTLYTELKSAAPEIENRWVASILPGTVREDNSVNYVSAGSGTGCAITKISKHKDEAWEFLKWWTSDKIQLKYSERVESILGPLGRLATANVKALKGMIWDPQMTSALNDQLENIEQIPEVPGGYYVARGIDQAFWNVVEQNQNPTDMMLEWGAVVDGEITRKLLEFAD